MSIPAGTSTGPTPPRTRVRPLFALLVAALLCALLTLPATAAEQDPGSGDQVVEVLPVHGFLDPPVASAIERVIAEAEANGASLVVLQVDGAGGLSADVDELLAAVRSSAVPVAVLGSPQQGTAAEVGGLYGLLWAAAPIRGLSDVATVGPVEPIDLASGGSLTGDQEHILGDIGAAGVRAERLDGDQLEGAGVPFERAGSATALLSALDGRQVQLADGTEVTLDLPAGEVTVRLHSMGVLARLLHAAAQPAFVYLLLVFGLGMLAFELFQPGFGVAGFAGLLLLPFAVFGLFVLPVTWWAFALLVGGLVLFCLDAALAGLGVTTAAATASFGVGSWFLFGDGPLRVPPTAAIVLTLVTMAFFVVVLTVILRAQAGPEGVDMESLVGRHGMVRSVLNPSGHVYIDEALWRARLSNDGRLKVGSPVTVVGVDGALLVVEPFSPDA